MTRRYLLKKQQEARNGDPVPKVKLPRTRPKLKEKLGKRVKPAWFVVLIPDTRQPYVETYETQDEVLSALVRARRGTLAHVFHGVRHQLTKGGKYLVGPDGEVVPLYKGPTELELDPSGLVGKDDLEPQLQAADDESDEEQPSGFVPVVSEDTEEVPDEKEEKPSPDDPFDH